MSNRISVLLLLTLIALLMVAAMEVRIGIPSAGNLRPSPGENESAATAKPVASSLPPLAALSETVERPLFSDSRRPAGEELEEFPVAAVPTPLGPSVQLIVSAIVITENDRAVLVTNPQSGDLTRVAEGETVAGWRLEKVEKDRAVFSKEGETREAVLRTFGPPPAGQRRLPPRPGEISRDRAPRRTTDGTRLQRLIPGQEPVSER